MLYSIGAPEVGSDRDGVRPVCLRLLRQAQGTLASQNQRRPGHEMDLRPYLKDRPELLQEGIGLIQQSRLWYQPFILADGIEVGEGQNLEDHYKDAKSIFDCNVFLGKGFEHVLAGTDRKLAADGVHFAASNRKYQLCYDRF